MAIDPARIPHTDRDRFTAALIARRLAESSDDIASARGVAATPSVGRLVRGLVRTEAGEELARFLRRTGDGRQLVRSLARSTAGRDLVRVLASSEISQQLAGRLVVTPVGRELAEELANVEAAADLAEELAATLDRDGIGSDAGPAAFGFTILLCAVVVLVAIAYADADDASSRERDQEANDINPLGPISGLATGDEPNLMDLSPYEFEGLVVNLFTAMGVESLPIERDTHGEDGSRQGARPAAASTGVGS